MAASKSQKNKPRTGPKLSKVSKQPFKAKKRPLEPTEQPPAPLVLEEDVPDFPRGGGSFISRKEREEIYAEADAQFEAGEGNSKKKRRKKMQKRGPPTEDDFGSLFGDGISGKLPRFANRITLKNVSPGMKLWGVITEVNEKDLVVSLPGGLRGLVRVSDAADPIVDGKTEESESNLFSSMFSVGQLVSCVVVQVGDDKKDKGRQKIWLSLCLSSLQKGFTLESIQEGMVLSAYVKSVEDHGYIVHFGVPSFTGFLPKASQAESKGLGFKTGKLLQAVVKSIDKARKVVYLSPDLDLVSKFVMKDVKGISIDLLVPGMMVNARVRSTLENGVMLSFLTYFTGTVDIFHLENPLPTKRWKDTYTENKKVNARILFVDPFSRAVGLTLNPHLIQNKAPPLHAKIGDICDDAKIVRVDRGLGVLLEISSTPQPTSAYVSMLDITEEETQKLEKNFKEGSSLRVRILGFRHLEGLAVGVVKAAAFEGSVFTHSDVKPGMLVRAKVIAVDSFGAIVQFSGGVKALCPLQHMSEFEIAKPRKKFKVGAELVFRVLGCKSKRVTVTHKKTLVKSKLAIISSYADATDGLITHGWITKIEKHGCFVRFYNGVYGFAPRHELGLEPGSDPSLTFHVGEVVKCRVIGAVPAARRINLSFITKPARISDDDVVKLGSLVSGVFEGVSPRGIDIYVKSRGFSKGTIPLEHLADNHEHVMLIKSFLKPGFEFEQLLVLDIEGNNLLLSAKYSLVNSAQDLPSDARQVHPNSIVPGYICNIIEMGCFVRFLGRLTGFSPRKKATDEERANLCEAFFVGQSVRSNILDVDIETGRITLSLKQSLCSSTDASLIKEYFLLEDKIAKLQSPALNGTEFKWVEGFSVGSIVEGKIQEKKDYGVVVSFTQYADVFGFITHYQLGESSVEVGSVVQAAVLDVAKVERLVDLSLKTEFIHKTKESSNGHSKKKRKKEANKDIELLQTVTAVVEIVKEKYLILAIPKCNYAVGYALLYDYNTQKAPRKQFLNGQSVTATVVALPTPATMGRLLLLLKSVAEVSDISSSKRARKMSNLSVGSLVQAEITEVKTLEMQLKFGVGLFGKVHVTEVNDDNLTDDPFKNFKVGQKLTARIVAKADSSNKRKGNKWELSIKPSLLTSSYEGKDVSAEDFNFAVGQQVSGFVYRVDTEWAWLSVSRHVKAQLFVLDTSCETHELEEFQSRFHVGKLVSGYVLRTNKEKKLLRLVSCSFVVRTTNGDSENENIGDAPDKNSKEDVIAHLHEGDIVGGRISKLLPGVGGLVVQLGPSVSGRVHYTEITDSWVPKPLSGYHEGQFVKCKVVEIGHTARGTVHVDLSLRAFQEGMGGKGVEELSPVNDTCKRVEKIEELQPNMVVQGYVKNITSKGCFIWLSRKLDAKILLSNLSDGYVENPEKEFPLGKLVKGRVLSVENLSKRVEVTLRTSSISDEEKSRIDGVSSLNVGSVVSGRIKRVEPYGLFITIDHTNLVGLCHISELSDDRVDNIESKHKAGDKVRVKILKVDEERCRISLGMKSSYFTGVPDIQVSSEEESDEPIREDNLSELMFPSNSPRGIEHMFIDASEDVAALAQAESRSSIPPLEVSLDEIENLEDNMIIPHQDDDKKVKEDETNRKRAKKKEKEEREREIRAAEERLLEKGNPRSPDDYEKLVRSSPNSSLAWINYMACMLSLADVEKARSIAERALKTINMEEENEKLNVWVAYFNLENEYGNPREEAVSKVFQRALQSCDTKKVHLALLGMYERTEQHKLASDLIEKMTKKFKQSCKVWLRRVQWLLKQQPEGVQSVVNRALLSLPQHKHIKFISKSAILEFKFGVPDRGRSLFEGILREYPKRTDLWSIYLDQEIKAGDVDVIRALFERATSLSLPLKKIKFLFKKYLAYEKTLGDGERIEYVKRKAMDYAESALE